MAIFRLTEKKRIRINRKCPEQPIYLAWFNLLGGIDYWLFSVTQTETVKVSGRVLFEKDIRDLENADSVMEFLSKEANRAFAIGDENLDDNDIEGLVGLLISPKVQILVGRDPFKWQTVLVDTGTFTIKETKERRFRVELSINKPELIIQTQ